MQSTFMPCETIFDIEQSSSEPNLKAARVFYGKDVEYALLSPASRTLKTESLQLFALPFATRHTLRV